MATIILAFLVTIALSLSLEFFDIKGIGIDDNINLFSKKLMIFFYNMNTDIFRTIMIFGFTCLLLEKKNSKPKESNRLISILAIFISFLTVLGYSYYKINSWDLIFLNKVQFLKALIVIWGHYVIVNNLLYYIFNYIIPKIKSNSSNNKIFKFIFEKHSFIMPLLIILVCWLPYIVIYYPGIMTNDASYQIEQFYGMDIYEGAGTNSVNLIDENMKITNHHPVIHTIILGGCVKIGQFFSNYNFGICLYTLIQMILFACALSYIINYMKKLKTNKWIRIISLNIFAMPLLISIFLDIVNKKKGISSGEKDCCVNTLLQ